MHPRSYSDAPGDDGGSSSDGSAWNGVLFTRKTSRRNLAAGGVEEAQGQAVSSGSGGSSMRCDAI